MKLILIGEEHLTNVGPQFLLHVLQIIKEKNLTCKIALEVPSIEEIEKLLALKSPYKEFHRKSFIDAALKLYPFFAADLANQESMDIRDEVIADQIIEQGIQGSPDIIVMLVGNLHIFNIQKKIKNRNEDIEILCCAPYNNFSFFFPSIVEGMIKENGFFYLTNQFRLKMAAEKINKFIDADLSSAMQHMVIK